MNANSSEPQPQLSAPLTEPPAQNNVSGTQNNVVGDQFNAAHDQFVGNQNVKAVSVNQSGASASRLGCLTVNLAVTIVSVLAVMAVSSVLVVNFVLTGPNLNGISVVGSQALRGPGLAAPLADGSIHGWAVGNGGAIYFYNGSNWQSYQGTATTNLNALYYDGTNGWIVGDGGSIFHIGQNDAVTPFRSPTTNNLRSVVGVNPTIATDDQGNIYSFSGQLWQAQTSAVAQPGLAVPSAYGTLVVHANGAIQLSVNTFNNSLLTRGGGVIMPQGSSVISNPIVAAAAPPDKAGPNQIWGVGAHGSIYGYKNGAWDNEMSPTSVNLNSIYFGTQQYGWIVGDGGVILSWDGQRWQQVSSPTNVNLHSIFVGAGNDAWAAGDKGHILHFDGGAWHQVK